MTRRTLPEARPAVRPAPPSAAPAELAERALAAVQGADGAQARVSAERSLTLRFARSQPTQATAVDDLTVELTVLRDGHLGGAVTNGTDGDSLAACARAAERAAAVAAASGSRGAYPGFPEPAPARPHSGHDPGTATLSPTPGGEALATAFDVARRAGVEAHGIWTAAEVRTGIASTTGLMATDAVTDAFLKVTAIAPGGRSGYAAQTAVAGSDIDPRAVAGRAAAKAATAEPARLPPGEYPVVMERHAVAELLYWLGRTALDGQAFVEGRSAFSGRLGSRVAAPGINLSDSPRYPTTLPRAFDAEGVPKGPVTLIQDGVAHGVAHDTASAARACVRSTGHALAPGGSGAGPRPTNLVLIGGGVEDETELCRPIERGVYVTRFWYVNAVRPKETLLTGVTRDGTFLIEDGQVTRPLEDLRFTDTVLGILLRTEALTNRPVLTSDGELWGRRFAFGSVCPALRTAAVRFTA